MAITSESKMNFGDSPRSGKKPKKKKKPTKKKKPKPKKGQPGYRG